MDSHSMKQAAAICEVAIHSVSILVHLLSHFGSTRLVASGILSGAPPALAR